MCLLREDHATSWNVPKGILPESSQSSGSSCQFARNTGDRWTCWIALCVQSAKSRLQETTGQTAQVFQRLNCKEKKKWRVWPTHHKWPPMSLPLYNPFLLNVGVTCVLLLANSIWQRWWDVTPMSVFCYRRLHLNRLEGETLLLVLNKKTAMMSTANGEGKKFQAVSRTYRWPWPPASKHLGPSVMQPPRNEICQQPQWA